MLLARVIILSLTILSLHIAAVAQDDAKGKSSPAGNSLEERKQRFSALDGNEDQVLSGKEARGLEPLDTNRDGEISLQEFLAGGSGGNPPEPVSEAPAVDPRQRAWDQQLAKQLDSGARWAVLIGVNKYQRLTPLRFCVSDTRGLAEALTNYCGVPKSNVLLLTDDQENQHLKPLRLNLQGQVSEFLKKASARDTVLISFSGHGFDRDGQSFLCPLDFDGDQPGLTGWRADELRTMLQDCRAAQKLLFLDCCHSGAAVSISGFGASPQVVGEAFAKSQGLITFAGCRRDQSALESDKYRRGVFANALIRGISGEADFDHNGIVDSDELYRHVQFEVPIAAQEVIPGHQQTPVRIIGQDVVGVFALSRPNGKLPPDPQQKFKPGDILANSIGMKFVVVPRGMFAMGSPVDEYLRDESEVLGAVLMTQPIVMGVFEVTQSQYARVMGANPSWFSAKGDGAAEVEGQSTGEFPVEQVSWSDATAFCAKLSRLPGETPSGVRYRLPTEAEWEYCCRAGGVTAFQTGESITSRQANIRGDHRAPKASAGKALSRTTKVGSYPRNGFGLHDMHGNVSEWCLDSLVTRRLFVGELEIQRPTSASNIIEFLEASLTAQGANRRVRFPENPRGTPEGDQRVLRGGSFMSDLALVRSAARREQNRNHTHRANGFRVVCEFPME